MPVIAGSLLTPSWLHRASSNPDTCTLVKIDWVLVQYVPCCIEVPRQPSGHAVRGITSILGRSGRTMDSLVLVCYCLPLCRWPGSGQYHTVGVQLHAALPLESLCLDYDMSYIIPVPACV